MRPKDLEAYDAWPLLLRNLARIGEAAAVFPYDDMLKVCDRMRLTGVYHASDGPRPVTTDLIEAQRRMVESAAAFRDAYLAIRAL